MDISTLIILIIAVAVAYRLSLALWPYTACRTCSGSGRNAGSNRRRWGACRVCGGSGRKERLGVRVLNRRR